MFITIKTKYYNLDDTVGDTLDLYTRLNKEVTLSDSYQTGIYEYTEDEDGADTQIFRFNNLQALETFLYYLLAKAVQVLAHSTGDDSYFDYTPSFIGQYQDFLKACQTLDLIQANEPEYLRDPEYTRKYSFPRALNMNIEFFNKIVLNHQSTGDGSENEQDWFECGCEPIN